MATVIAGFKRSYHDMTGAPPSSRFPEAGPVSRLQSPSGLSSRASSQPPDLLEDGKLQNGSELPRNVSFEPLASIVLIGVRGVGKSTLGVLAAAAYSRRLVDIERAFLENTGITATAYRKAKGSVEFQTRHNKVFESTLSNNSSGAVIVCNFSDLESRGASILQKYAQSHPVIHVTRDPEGVQSYLKIWTKERVQELLSASTPLLRSCSTYEFFNLTDNGNGEDHPWNAGSAELNEERASQESFLTLKRVEHDFVRLLRNIIGDNERGQAHHSAYPFSQIQVERRRYTFAVTMRMSEILDGSVNFDEAQIGADCVELLVDMPLSSKRRYHSELSKAFAALRRATILPILISVVGEGTAKDQQHHDSMIETLNLCLRLGTDMCTVDLAMTDSQLKGLIMSKGHSRIIGRLELSQRPEDGWNNISCVEAFSRAAELGCDLVKITMPAGSVDDTFACQALQDRVRRSGMRPDLIAYNTGSRGRSSRCFNRTLTSVKPHRKHSGEAYSRRASTDVSAQEVTQALFAAFVFEPMRFFIYGGDVSYSLSPAMHNAAYEACGMRYAYEAVSSDNITKLKEITHAHDFGGTAITQPYKTVALGMMDALSPHAKAIGAVNTIVPVRELSSDGSIPSEIEIISQRNQQGQVKALYGFNTDWIGICACIRRGLSPANTIRPHTSALVCGAGGMARSAIYSLISLGIRNIFICNRTYNTATTLAKHYNDLIHSGGISELRPENAPQTHVTVLESFASRWPGDARAPTIVVCCIPRQTPGEAPTNFVLPESWLKSPTGGVVLEIAYRQPPSTIAHQVKAKAQGGWIFMDGYDVLPEQAFSQFELFTGRRAPRKLMRDEIRRHISS